MSREATISRPLAPMPRWLEAYTGFDAGLSQPRRSGEPVPFEQTPFFIQAHEIGLVHGGELNREDAITLFVGEEADYREFLRTTYERPSLRENAQKARRAELDIILKKYDDPKFYGDLFSALETAGPFAAAA